MSTYIITIAGDGARWALMHGVRKHMVAIAGEPNLLRTIRLIKEFDPSAQIIVGCNMDFFPKELDELDIVTYDGRSYLKGTEADRYFASMPFWSPNGRTTLIWGDVFFTKAALKTVCAPKDTWHRYGRPGAGLYKSYGEEFAIDFYPEHCELVRRSSALVEDISLRTSIQLFGAVYLAMLGKQSNTIINDSTSGRKPNYGHMIEIDDLTDDFDFPSDYERFLQLYRGDD